MSLRGYYQHYPFFGHVTYQTGYLFGHRVPTLIDYSVTVNGILIRGPNFGDSHPIVDGGWVLIRGKLICGSWPPALRVRSWKAAPHAPVST